MMAIHYRFTQQDDLLIVKAWGHDESLEDARNYNRAVKQEAEKHGCTKVLADERELEYRLSVIDTYKLAEDLAELVNHLTKIAVVTHEANQEAADFWENVAANRGLRARVFYDYDQALEWIMD